MGDWVRGPSRHCVPARWQLATPLDSPSTAGSLWPLEAQRVSSKCFPYLFSLRNSNTRAGSALPAPCLGPSAPHTHPPTHAAAMGKDKQTRGQQRQGGPPAADATGPDDMGPKKGKGASKECGEEEARTCCGCRFPLLLALLQLALGIAVTVVGFLMASISSSLLVRDTPFWAGIIVSIKSVLPKRVCGTGMRSRMVELRLTQLHAPFPSSTPLTRALLGD